MPPHCCAIHVQHAPRASCQSDASFLCMVHGAWCMPCRTNGCYGACCMRCRIHVVEDDAMHAACSLACCMLYSTMHGARYPASCLHRAAARRASLPRSPAAGGRQHGSAHLIAHASAPPFRRPDDALRTAAVAAGCTCPSPWRPTVGYVRPSGCGCVAQPIRRRSPCRGGPRRPGGERGGPRPPQRSARLATAQHGGAHSARQPPRAERRRRLRHSRCITGSGSDRCACARASPLRALLGRCARCIAP